MLFVEGDCQQVLTRDLVLAHNDENIAGLSRYIINQISHLVAYHVSCELNLVNCDQSGLVRQ